MQIAPPPFADQREDQVAPSVDIVGRRSAARESPAGRGCRPPTRRSDARDRSCAGCFNCAAPRISSHNVDQHRSIAGSAVSGARHDAPPEAAAPSARQGCPVRVDGRVPPAAPRTSTTSRGSQVGSPSGANAACAICTYQEVSPPPPTPTIFRTKSIGNTTSPTTIASSGTATSATRQRQRPRSRTAASSATDTASRTAGDRQKPLLVPQPLRAVDRREQRADDADAMRRRRRRS